MWKLMSKPIFHCIRNELQQFPKVYSVSTGISQFLLTNLNSQNYIIQHYGTKIYTKTGDKGSSSLFTGERRPKFDPIFDALGDIDELTSNIGMCREVLQGSWQCGTGNFDEIRKKLEKIQCALQDVNSCIATPLSSANEKLIQRTQFDSNLVTELEQWIDHYTEDLPELKNFILPSGGKTSCALHICRSICRRAERKVSVLFHEKSVNEDVSKYVNRLSDFLFTLARYAANMEGNPEVIYKKPKSQVILLCGGYGTRFVHDINNHQTDEYKHLMVLPKALLPIGECPLISHWMKLFQSSGDIERVYIETNGKFYKMFKEWSSDWFDFVSVVSDNTCSNETRLGAVAAIQYTTKHFQIDDDAIVVAGDTLFYQDFHLSHVINHYKKLRESEADCSLVMVYECSDADVCKHGILEVDENHRVTSFLEKPNINDTSSRLACPCFYLLSPRALLEVSSFLKLNEDSPMSEKDATGNFLNHLHKRLPVYTYKISGRFDVGGLASYTECLKYFS